MPEMTLKGHRVRASGRVIIGAVIAALAFILICQNTHDVQVHVLFWHADRPLWLWFLLLFAGGFVVGSLFPWGRLARRRQPKENATAVSTSEQGIALDDVSSKTRGATGNGAATRAAANG